MDASAGPSSSKPKKSKPKARDLLEYTWFIKATEESVDTHETIFHAGAICVHPDGYLVTVTHGITLPRSSYYPDIVARRYNETFRSVKVIDSKSWEAFGLLLLKVEKTSMDEEEFKAFPIPSEDISIDPGKTIPIHAFICHELVPFSYKNGNTSYIYPNNLRVPIDQFSTFSYDGDFTGRTISSFTKPGTIWSPSDISASKSMRSFVGDGIYEACQNLNGTIPLLQVSGFDVHVMDGQIGWPVFTEDNKLLLGLFFLPTKTHQFVIPAQLVHEVLRRFLSSRSRQQMS